MPALVAGIHVLSCGVAVKDVDGRDISAFTRVHSPSKTGVYAL
jgi:hypothetical protein